MHSYSVMHSKGGVGKSTMCKNVGAYLAELGHRVLMLDMDRQMTLTTQMRLTASEILPRIFTDQVIPKTRPIKTYIPGIDLMPCHSDLSEVVEEVGKERCGSRLRVFIDRVSQDYDIMLIDAPPSWGPVNEIMLFVTDEVIIPCRPTQANIEAITPTLCDIDDWLKEHPGFSIPVRHVLWTMVTPGDAGHRYILKLTRDYKFPTFDTMIRFSRPVERSEIQYKTIFEYSSRSSATHDYRDLVREMLDATE